MNMFTTMAPSDGMFHSSIKDCSTPSETGYEFTGATATTYLGTSNVTCATGYDGTASPPQIQCEASGSWTAVTGCTIKGKPLFSMTPCVMSLYFITFYCHHYN